MCERCDIGSHKLRVKNEEGAQIMSDIPESIKVIFDQLRDEVMWMHTK